MLRHLNDNVSNRSETKVRLFEPFFEELYHIPRGTADNNRLTFLELTDIHDSSPRYLKWNFVNNQRLTNATKTYPSSHWSLASLDTMSWEHQELDWRTETLMSIYCYEED